MFKLHREKRFLISPNISKAFKMQYDVFVKYGDCYKRIYCLKRGLFRKTL